MRETDLLADRYRLEGVLGVGGMGTVTRAHDRVLDRAVAVKLLKEELTGDEAGLERFRREARIAASLSHPGIAQVFDFHQEEGHAFIVMELLEGADLHAHLSREGPMGPAAAAEVAARAADALEHAHTAGAVHRDIKPSNIFLTRGGEVKVTDFGIAYAASQVPVTTTGQVLGTPFYLSPEQIDGERATAASDVYALGCVLFQLLTGRPPFAGESAMAVARAHLSEPVPRARSLNPSVPEEIDDVVRTALAKDPDDRFPSAGTMAAALRAAAGAGATPPAAQYDTRVLSEGPPTVVETPAARAPVRRRRPILSLLILLAAGLLLGLFLGRLRGDRTVRLPDWSGLPYETARAEARRIGILEVVRVEELSDLPKGTVIRQRPEPGKEVAGDAVLTLTVSDGRGVRVPRLVGISLEDAQRLLVSKGLEALVVDQVAGERDDVVVGQDPPEGQLAARGSVVRLTISFERDEDRRGKNKGQD